MVEKYFDIENFEEIININVNEFDGKNTRYFSLDEDINEGCIYKSIYFLCLTGSINNLQYIFYEDGTFIVKISQTYNCKYDFNSREFKFYKGDDMFIHNFVKFNKTSEVLAYINKIESNIEFI